MNHVLFAMLLTACASSQEPAVGVSTAPNSVPHAVADPPDAAAEPPAATTPRPDAGSVESTAPPAVDGRLHAVTGMTLGGHKLDAKAVVSRIETMPAALDACSALASQEPNAPDGSWNAKLSIKSGKASVQMQSPVKPAFETCVAAAAAQWSLGNVGSGEMMLLLGIAH